MLKCKALWRSNTLDTTQASATKPSDLHFSVSNSRYALITSDEVTSRIRHDLFLSISPTFGPSKNRRSLWNALKRLAGRYTEIHTCNFPDTNQFWPRSGRKKNRGSFSGSRKGHSPSPKREDRRWGPPCALFNGNWGLILQRWKSQGLRWRLITNNFRCYKWMEPCLHSIIRLREVYRDNFSFELTSPE
jgi:hypothetical protein